MTRRPPTRRAKAVATPKTIEKALRNYALEDQVGFLLRLANQRHTAIFAAGMIDGLTPTQFAALAKLRANGPCSQNRLGRLISVDAATIKGVIDRLAARGLIKRTQDPKDRRRRAVTLSETGRETAERAVLAATAITEATLVPLGPKERVALIKLLRVIT